MWRIRKSRHIGDGVGSGEGLKEAEEAEEEGSWEGRGGTRTKCH